MLNTQCENNDDFKYLYTGTEVLLMS